MDTNITVGVIGKAVSNHGHSDAVTLDEAIEQASKSSVQLKVKRNRYC